MSQIPLEIGSQIVDLCSALLLVTCFAIVAQRRLSACVDLYALQSFFLAATAALVAFLTGTSHLYVAAGLNVLIKVGIIPRILKRIVERLQVKREVELLIGIAPSLLACGALVIFSFYLSQPILSMGPLLTRDSLAIGLAILLIGCFTMVSRQQAVTQVVGFLVIENGLFLVATAAVYGMPLIVELGIFFDVLVAAIVIGIFVHRIQDTFEQVKVP